MTQTTNGDAQHLHRPRILCLHGGGVNAAIFEVQCRAVIAQLRASFRLVFVEGPFLSAPHPSVVAVYGDHGPFRRWLRWLPEHPDIDAESAAAEIRYSCRRAMDDDPGDGEWVGILGFSQGAKIAASVLWTQQQAGTEAETDFKFGVLMAGRGPFVALDPGLNPPRHVVDAAQLSSAFADWPKTSAGPHALAIPTLHVHGTRDPGLELHRILRDKYCAPGTARLIEWDGGHRIPIKPHDVDALVQGILDLARDAGV
ncbi:serine hydrolase FSH [Dactylonectria estremocensis]|uniref:Serine hydrolase FSH n=1 Tax=Dactylonectria estremocensis TaxID=1079267 RepID=A0A9P9IFQ5_9HYPO|nr:serine hydrolase FSH [Dactylonectria estremocensis]